MSTFNYLLEMPMSSRFMKDQIEIIKWPWEKAGTSPSQTSHNIANQLDILFQSLAMTSAIL